MEDEWLDEDYFSAKCVAKEVPIYPTAKSVANYIRKKPTKKIVFLNGWGISANTGYPKSMGKEWEERVGGFKTEEGANVFYQEALNYLPGKKEDASKAHLFIKKVMDEGKLHHVITSNSDCFEAAVGIPPGHIKYFHGRMDNFWCMKCKAKYSLDDVRQKIVMKEVPKCGCGGIVRPGMIIEGETYPEDMIKKCKEIVAEADLVFVVGSSLIVKEFLGVCNCTPHGVPIVFVNPNEPNGLTGEKVVHIKGKSDAFFEELQNTLGW